MAGKIKRELIEWLLLIGFVGVLYITGLHTQAIGQLQRLILASHIMTPNILDENEVMTAEYQFKLRDIQGDLMNFSDLKGKTVLLNFWATWCPPCIAEMPDLNDLYEKVSEEVVFVMISRDEDFEKAKKFVEKKEYSFPIYQLASSLPKIYHSQSIPTTFVISPNGKIVSKTTGMAKYDTDDFRKFLEEISE